MGDAHERPTHSGKQVARDMEHTKPVAKEILVQPDPKTAKEPDARPGSAKRDCGSE